MQRVLIIGGNGMLGHKLVQILGRTFEVWTTIRGRMDDVERYHIFDRSRTLCGIDAGNIENLENAIALIKPDAVINAVGIIKQLPSSGDVIQTLTVNSILPHRLYEMSRRHGFRLICISTDCVFSGNRGMYTEEDAADALSLYGRSKNLGEVVGDNCLTIRTSIIGRELATTHSMVEWFLSNRGGKVNGYANAIYSGFPTVVFADIIGDLLLRYPDLNGLYHVSSDPIGKFDLLEMINDRFDAKVEIARYEDFKIDRSLDSSKFRADAGFMPSPWENMIERMASDAAAYERYRQ